MMGNLKLCMNNWNHKYPKNIPQLIDDNLSIAIKLEKRLNDESCPKLAELYSNEGKVKRQQQKFNKLGYEPNVKGSKKVKSNNEFKGLYVFGEELNGKVTPVYVGISRTVFRRLRQHGWGSKHNQCTLAYLLAIDNFYDNNYNGARIDVEDDKLQFGKDIVQNFKVTIIGIPEDFNLYFLEVTLAGHWKTKWNSFRTH